jgi:hypothetical protein
MPILSKGCFSLNLGLVRLSGELTDDDRQCAWELYTELSTRVAVTGKPSDPECSSFDGELYIESLNSLYAFFQEARKTMRKFPVGKISHDEKDHLGALISRIMENILRPFLEKWHVKYRHWWENLSNPRRSPFDRQSEYHELEAFLKDWSAVRWLMREVQKELVRAYGLLEVKYI